MKGLLKNNFYGVCVKKAHLNGKNINSLSRLDEKPLLKVNILVIQYGVYLGL